MERTSECKWDGSEQHTAAQGRTKEAKDNRMKKLLMRMPEQIGFDFAQCLSLKSSKAAPGDT